MSVHHKRPLLAFIVVALICGMVIGHTLVTQAVPALWARPMAVVEGLVFAPAAAGEPAVSTASAVAPVAAAPQRRVTIRPAATPSPRASARAHPVVATRPAHRVATTRHTPRASQRKQVVSARQVGWTRHTDTTTPSAAAHARKHGKHATKHSHGWHGGRWSHLAPAFRWR